MPPKERIKRVRFTDASRPANPSSTPLTSSCATNQPQSFPCATPTANLTPNTTPTFPALSSNISTPLTLSPQTPTFDIIINKIFSRLKALYPDFHPYWRDLHVRSSYVCVDEKVAIHNVLHEALIDDIHASHPGTWRMIFMVTHC